MDDSNNWDLQAVVRGCGSATAAVQDPFSSFLTDEFIEEFVHRMDYDDDDFSSLVDPVTTENTLHELQELCKPFFSTQKSSNQSEIQEMKQQLQRPPAMHNPRAKKSRRNQQKKVVCQVPADGLPSDMWAWRKYGQKPIKGSPYPRGYYRCSSSKGCLARKQVERSRTDPTMLIITYTAEHNHAVPTHRNSLAGSTRNKFPQNLTSNSEIKAEPSNLPANMTATLSPTTPLMASMENDDELDQEDEEGGSASIGDMMGEIGDQDEDMQGFLNSEGFGDDDDFMKSFFSDSWKINNHSDGGR